MYPRPLDWSESESHFHRLQTAYNHDTDDYYLLNLQWIGKAVQKHYILSLLFVEDRHRRQVSFI